nr:MAG TPA: hypothetical protein [Caudoviricetes sp.]
MSSVNRSLNGVCNVELILRAFYNQVSQLDPAN